MLNTASALQIGQLIRTKDTCGLLDIPIRRTIFITRILGRTWKSDFLQVLHFTHNSLHLDETNS